MTARLDLTFIKKTDDYKRIAKTGKRVFMPAFTMQGVKGDAGAPLRVGLTVSRHVGTSVLRSRVKRRLREAVRLACKQQALSGGEVVLIAKTKAVEQSFDEITQDFLKGLKTLGIG